MFVPSSAYEPYSTFVPYFVPYLVSFLYMMIVRMKIHLLLLTFLQMSPLNMNMHQHHRFPDGFVQLKK
jgi:hypothetical protein